MTGRPAVVAFDVTGPRAAPQVTVKPAGLRS